MAGGHEREGSKKTACYSMKPKKRCCIDGCKKRARRFIEGIPYCRKHCQTDPQNSGEWILTKDL